MRLILGLLVVAWRLLGNPALAAKEPQSGSIYDYMVMSVCVDGDDHIVVGQAPPDCRHVRKLRDRENLPYHLSDFQFKDEDCKPGQAAAPIHIHDNVPMTHNGVLRTVTAVSVDYDRCSADPSEIPAFYEVHWFDRFGFIMGAWARGHEAGGSVGGGITPRCAEAPGTSVQYDDFWVLGPARPPASGSVGYAVFQNHGYNSGLPPLSATCPTRFTPYLAVWTRGRFTYGTRARPSYTLDTMISNPYSQADKSGATPGDSRQMERTYWTREFGQTRWEGWKRDDFVDGKTGSRAIELGRNAFATCTKPYELKGKITPAMAMEGVNDDGTYNQSVTDTRTGETHVWYLAECLDMTRLVFPRNPKGDPAPSGERLSNPAFWNFWAEGGR